MWQTSLEGLAGGIAQWDREEILARSQPDDGGALEASCWVGPHEPYYTIFTSGSTGRPKGVQISRESLDNFTGWAVDLLQLSGPAAAGHPTVLLNQAPFSFDLSVFDMALALATGGTLFSVDRAQIARLPELHAALASSDVTVWVSTPSFADLCLSDPAFGQELLPRLGLFLFCGETLTPRTAGALLERFPGARIVNTYGPTESTVAVTAVEVDRALLESWPVLPVGRPRPGSTICILDEQGVSLPEGTDGEIAIQGDTLSLGYLGRPDLDARAFTTVEGGRAYRTGDRGRLDGGMLHFAGRLDFQVKLHGYRIEVEDIEANLLALPQVARAVVLPETGADGAISHLHAWVQESAAGTGSELGRMVALKKALRERVPDYMVPKVISFVDAIPLTANGKVDRAAVRGLQ